MRALRRMQRRVSPFHRLFFLSSLLYCGLWGLPGAGGHQQVVGDLEAWDSVFGSRRAEEVLRKPGPAWFEGPQYWRSNILFSDTINDRIYKYDKRTGSSVFRHASGGASAADLKWMAEPGSNGIVIDQTRPNTAYICQHGAHAVSRLNLQSKEITPLVDHFKGSRLNGPNDLVLDKKGEYLYFTDPTYAFLKKTRFQDGAYVDLECSKHLGVKGVYRLKVNGSEADLQLLDGFRLQRPNGLALSEDGRQLYVGECCQGTHISDCRQGTVRYHVYDLLPSGTLSHVREIVFHLTGDSSKNGCADGFKVHPQSGLIVSSCASGICLVRPGPASSSLEGDQQRVAGAGENGNDGNGHQSIVNGGEPQYGESVASEMDENANRDDMKPAEGVTPEVDDSKSTNEESEREVEGGARGVAQDSSSQEEEIGSAEKRKDGRGLLSRDSGEDQEVGLVARLEFGAHHPVSNVLLAADGHLYVTAQDPSGAGLLLKIPLRQDTGAEIPSRHEELR